MTILPPVSTALELRLEQTHEIKLDPSVILQMWDPWTCPMHLLPQLAWALSVDEWDDNWDEATQRRVVATSVQIHRLKGTVGAVELAMNSLGHTTRMVEWFDMSPPGEPYTFNAEIDIDQRGISESLLGSLERQINRAKNVRSHYMLRLIGRSTSQFYIACATVSGETVEIQPLQLSDITVEPAQMIAGIGGQHWGTVTIYPSTES